MEKKEDDGEQQHCTIDDYGRESWSGPDEGQEEKEEDWVKDVLPKEYLGLIILCF